jgi:hypothetical protein
MDRISLATQIAHLPTNFVGGYRFASSWNMELASDRGYKPA